MTYSVELIDRKVFGVRIPEWLRVFDCRGEIMRTESNRALYSSDKATWDLGLDSDTECNSSCPISCSTHIDSRSCDESELARQMADMVSHAKKAMTSYVEAVNMPGDDKGHGGTGHDKPIAIALSNYGWSVICDRRLSATKFFR
jgi:hypothetical protein